MVCLNYSNRADGIIGMGIYMSRPGATGLGFVASEDFVSGWACSVSPQSVFGTLGLITALAPIRIGLWPGRCLRCRSKPQPQLE